MSFAETIAKKSSTPIHYIWGTQANGEFCYFFIMCSKQKYDALKEHFGQGNVNIEDYGAVVASGWGKKPDEATKQKLINEYKVNWEDYSGSLD